MSNLIPFVVAFGLVILVAVLSLVVDWWKWNDGVCRCGSVWRFVFQAVNGSHFVCPECKDSIVLTYAKKERPFAPARTLYVEAGEEL